MKELEKYPKVKEAFLKWYNNNPYLPEYWILIKTPFSMQFGAWVDFCDTKNISIDIHLEGIGYDFDIKDRMSGSLLFTEYIYTNTRTEARQEAFKQSLTILKDKI